MHKNKQYIDMKTRGFTIVELLVVITVMSILIPVTMFSMRGLGTVAQDRERESDAGAIARRLELVYTNKLVDSAPNYPGTDALTASNKETIFGGNTANVTKAPGAAGFSIVAAATNSTTVPATVSPRPLATTFVYQPLKVDGTACQSVCARFNLYYKKESDNTVIMIKSKRQQ